MSMVGDYKNDEEDAKADESSPPPLVETLARIPNLVRKEDLDEIINFQVAAIDRLEGTNKNLVTCSTLAQNKLASTTKLFKKTAKQMSEAKKDLDVIYKKIIELKTRIKAERPDLYVSNEELPSTSPS